MPCTPRVGRLCQPRAVIEENKDRYYETLEPKFSALGMGARTMRGLISITFSSFSRVRTPILRNELAAQVRPKGRRQIWSFEQFVLNLENSG